MKVLFVCLGNICRSPLAEGIFKRKVKALNMKVYADSCGTSDYHIGELPDIRTRKNAMKNGVELDHRGRQLVEADLEEFDFILVMDQSNYQNVFRLNGATHASHKVKLLRQFDPTSGDEVPDPYYGNEKDFQEVFDILDRSIDGFIEHLNKEFLKP